MKSKILTSAVLISLLIPAEGMSDIIIVGEDYLISPLYYPDPTCSLGTTDRFNCVSGMNIAQFYAESERVGTNKLYINYSKYVTVQDTTPSEYGCGYSGAVYDLYNCSIDMWVCHNGDYWDDMTETCRPCPQATNYTNVIYSSSERVDPEDSGPEMCYITTDGGTDHTGIFVYNGSKSCWYDDSGS
ncbi:MAG: hypothetical protein NC311_01745 [Muribaculaceae bacterium]|nr:hypothetical protein [Muribaculaceae bacterium]